MGCGASSQNANVSLHKAEEQPKPKVTFKDSSGSAGGRRKTTTVRAATNAPAPKRREAVSSGVLEEEKGELTLTPKTVAVSVSLLEAFKSHPLFEYLEPQLQQRCVDAMAEQAVQAGTNVITEGEKGDHFYVVYEGSFEAVANSGVVLQTFGGAQVAQPDSKAGSTRCFGELALLYDSPRACSVQAKTDGIVFALDRRAFRQLVMQHNSSLKHGLERHLATVPILQQLQPDQLSRLADAMKTCEFKDGEYILEMGAEADALFLLVAGEVVCHRQGGDKELLRLQQGAFFGESALDTSGDSKRLANVVAVGDVRVARLAASTFSEVFDGGLSDIVRRNFNRKVIDSVALLAPLKPSDKEGVLDVLDEVSFEAGHHVIEQGAVGTNFYIIKSGAVRVLQAGVPGEDPQLITTLEAGQHFGERALLTAEPCVATVVTAEPTQLMTLDKVAFERVLGPLQDLIQREVEEREAQAARLARPQIDFGDLRQLAVLGEGSFGRVRLVVHTKGSGTPYALKSLHKGLLIKLGQVDHVIGEKKVLASCGHPFILRLEAVFNTGAQVHMLLELALGGELFSLLRQAGRLDDESALLYTAQVTSAFAYLHEREIGHRDLKPENLLFDAEGYLKLVDFGFAKVIKDRSWTLCGTPEYLAPEIISNQGHNWAVDQWTLGILLYEMLVGTPPFVAESPVDTYNKIMRGKYKIPTSLSGPTKSFIAKLLVHSQASRLGCVRIKEVYQQAYLATLDFGRLEQRKMRMPFTPDIRDPLDTSNFDEYPEEDADARTWAAFNDKKYESKWTAEFGSGTRC